MLQQKARCNPDAATVATEKIYFPVICQWKTVATDFFPAATVSRVIWKFFCCSVLSRLIFLSFMQKQNLLFFIIICCNRTDREALMFCVVLNLMQFSIKFAFAEFLHSSHNRVSAKRIYVAKTDFYLLLSAILRN